MNILLLSRYGPLGASSRMRSYQYLDYLEARGHSVTVAELFGDGYVQGLYSGAVSRLGVLRAYARRLFDLRRARSFDLVWIEKELLPWLPAWFELGLLGDGAPFVVDYDDAIFHRYDRHRWQVVRAALGRKIDSIMARAAAVIVGNEYLAQRARDAGARRVEWLPTVVDADRYRLVDAPSSRPVTVGWIGSPSTAPHLVTVASALKKLVADGLCRLVVVGANPAQVADIPAAVLPWTMDSEIACVQEFDVGIMPLPDQPFERGKCGYKLIQYMACGKPVVASPVGVNSVIVRNGVEGFLADAEDEWISALTRLCRDDALRRRMGAAGRRRVEESYSLSVAAPRLEAILLSCSRTEQLSSRATRNGEGAGGHDAARPGGRQA